MARPTSIPKYCRHRSSNRAYVTIGFRQHYLGEYGSPESRRAYARLIAEWEASGRRAQVDPGEITVAEVCDQYVAFAREHYSRRRSPVKAMSVVRSTTKRLNATYGDIKAVEFTPKKLLAVRAGLVADGLSRTVVNGRVQIVQRMFRWAVVQEMVPGTVAAALNAVRGLRAGESDAAEPRKITPIDDEHVNAVKPHVSRQAAAMLGIMQLTGCRPGEIVIIRGRDIDMAGPVWIYRPAFHKNDARGKSREICLGPKCQEIVKGFLRPALDEYLFDPRDAVREKHAACKVHRHQPTEPAETSRRVRDRYDTDSFARAVVRGCDLAFPPPKSMTDPKERAAWRRSHRFGLHRIRHAFASKIARAHGSEIARAMLGHSTILTTEVYVERDRAASKEVALRIG